MADVHARSVPTVSAAIRARRRPIALVVMAGAMMVAGACAEDPRIARRQGALDVAGTWSEQRDDDAVGASVVIVTEADKNDVAVTLVGRVVGVDEATALAGVIDPTRRADLATTLELGVGRDAVREETDGGENVSFDLGATTTVQVTSALEPVSPSSPTSRDAAIGWSLRLDGDDALLDGSLEVFVRETQARPGDVNGFGLVTTRVESVALRLVPTEP